MVIYDSLSDMLPFGVNHSGLGAPMKPVAPQATKSPEKTICLGLVAYR